MRSPFRIACFLAIALLVPAALAGEEAREVQELRAVDTAAGVTVSIQMANDKSRAESFVVQSVEGLSRIACAIPRDEKELAALRIGLVPKLDAEGQLHGIEIATWRPAAKGEAPAEHRLMAEPGKAQRIETADFATIRPLWKDAEGRRTLKGFELLVLAGSKEKGEKGAIDPTAQTGEEEGCGEEGEPEEAVEYRKITIDLPERPSGQNRYGLLLKPMWKEKGKALEGFEAILGSMPRPEGAEG